MKTQGRGECEHSPVQLVGKESVQLGRTLGTIYQNQKHAFHVT